MTKKKSLFPSAAVERFHNAAAGLIFRAGGTQASDKPKWLCVEGASDGKAPTNQCHILASNEVQAGRAKRQVSGWMVEHFMRKSSTRMSLLLSHHSVVEHEDGSLSCPTTAKGDSVFFFEDHSRSFDRESLRMENMYIIGSEPLELVVGDYRETIPAFTPARAADTGWGLLMSVNPKHGQWVAFAHQNPFDFARAVGADPRGLFDMAFVSDLTLMIPQIPQLSQWNPFEADEREVTAVLEGLEEAVKAGLIVTHNKAHQSLREGFQAQQEADR